MSNPGARAVPPDPSESTRPKPLRIHFVRHGSSAWNDAHRIQGQLDPPLSERGREQAARLASRLRGCRYQGFYTSDLSRARDTAAAIAREIGQEPVLLAELREVGLGEWEGLTRDEIVARYPAEWERWASDPNWDIVPGGEGAAAFEHRVGAVVDRLVAEHPAGDVLVVTHGGVIQVALLRVVGRRSRGLFPFTIHNTSITVLEGRPGQLVIGRVNDTCHLS
jgi:alpha-ribazole phosphatase/probable phosphoglycerate mutase